ncbi:MAG: DUF5320 domain-containing protein [Nanoarchaeota archaeon]|nr:DUF5320 domain-containing protein [Nanoarchaeota archaeon]
MPRGDGTGPNGMGSMTGRGMGYCAGYNAPGFASGGFGRGRGMGFGRGFRRMAFMRQPLDRVVPVAQAPAYAQPTKEQETMYLENEAKAIEAEQSALKQELETVKKRLDELKKQK